MQKMYLVILVLVLWLTGCGSLEKPVVKERQTAITIEQIYDAFLGGLQSVQFPDSNKLERRIVGGVYKNGQITQMLVADLNSLPISLYEATNKSITISKTKDAKREFLTCARSQPGKTEVVGIIYNDAIENSLSSRILSCAHYPDGSTMFLAVVLSFDIKEFDEQKIKNIQ